MYLRSGDIVLRRIGANHLGTQSRQRFRQDAAAAADIQHAQPLQAVELFGAAFKARRCLIADVAKPYRIELVQGRHGPAWIPPIGGVARKTLDLSRINAGYASFSSNHSNRPPAVVAGQRPRRYVYAPFRV